MDDDIGRPVTSRYVRCIKCLKIIRGEPRLKRIKIEAEVTLLKDKLNKDIQLNDVLCNNCRIDLARKDKSHKRAPPASDKESLKETPLQNEEAVFQLPAATEGLTLPDRSGSSGNAPSSTEAGCSTQTQRLSVSS